MKNWIYGFIVAALLTGVGYPSYQAYQLKQQYDFAVSYLFGPSGVKDEHGNDVSRAQMIDKILIELVERQQNGGN